MLLLKESGLQDNRFFSSCETPFGEISKKLEDFNLEEKIPWPEHFYNKFEVEIYDMNKLIKEEPDEIEKNLFGGGEGDNLQIVTTLTYCKRLFAWLRNSKFFVSLKTMLSSLSIENNQMVISGKSKKLHHQEFVTFDNRLVISIISKEVKKFLTEEFLKSYHEHVNKKQSTFLPHLLGLYSFQLQSANSHSNQSYSILIYENPFMEHHLYKTKKLLEHPPKEILSIYYIQAEKIKKKNVYKCEQDDFDIEHSDLKLNSEEKTILLNILYDDLAFLAIVGAFNYRFCLIFFKFEDTFLIESSIRGEPTEKILRKNKRFSKNKFLLKNNVGFCVGMLRDVFKFLQKKHKRRKKEKMRFDVAINKEVSVNNPNNYSRFLYEQAQDL